MTEERWKAIPSHPDYEISDHGRVRKEDHIYKTSVIERPIVELRASGVVTWGNVHVLVAQAFVEGEAPGLVVHHLDEVKWNNHYLNLQWITGKLNTQLSRNKAVNQFDLEGALVHTYESRKEASEDTGIHKDGISNVCRGVSKTAGGFKWEYV